MFQENEDESWFWEPEKDSSSSSSKNDNEISKSPSGGDLTMIPLDNTENTDFVVKLQNRLRETEQKLKKSVLENAVLNEKLVQIASENKELNNNIDELDKQHNLAVEEVLVGKNVLQEKIAEQKGEIEKLQQISNQRENMQQNVNSLEEKYEKLLKSYEETLKANLSQQDVVNNLKKELENAVNQSEELTTILESKEEILKGLKTLQKENLTSEQQFIQLQKNNEHLHQELIELKDQLQDTSDCSEKINKIQNQFDDEKLHNESLRLETKKLLEQIDDLQSRLYESEENYKQLLLEKETEIEEYKNLLEKSQKSEKHLQSVIIDLQSNLNSRSIEITAPIDQLSFTELKSMIEQYSNFHAAIDDDKQYFEEYLKSSRDTHSKLSVLEKKLIQVSEEKDTVLREKGTLQADLMHYEIECSELMKNNELLLSEIDLLKSGKLETIHENNEDSIVILEQQLEDCSNLNKSLEDEYIEVQQKLESIEADKDEIATRLHLLESEVSTKNEKCRELQLQIDLLETEKSNLIFEVNELKTDDYKAAHESEILDYKSKVVNLEKQLFDLSADHGDLVRKIQELQETVLKQKTHSDKIISEQKKTIEQNSSKLVEEHENTLKLALQIEDIKSKNINHLTMQDEFEKELNKLQEQITVKDDEISQLKASLKLKEETYLSDAKRLNETISDLQKTQLNDESQDQESLVKLKQSLESITQEKDNLISLITLKHNESLQYHGEIQRLSQLLQTEAEKYRILYTEYEKLTTSTVSSEDHEKLKDQVAFLREKSDIMTKNLLAEQTNQKLLAQEKNEIVEQRNTLNRDLDRLRQHLMEIEEAHTIETVELQKIIDENKAKIAFYEDEVKKSSTAYTSARYDVLFLFILLNLYSK